MDAADDVCKICGSPVQKLNRNWSKFAKISVITLIIAAFGAYIALYNLDIIGPDFFRDAFGSAPAAEEPATPDVGYVRQEPVEVADGQGEAVVEQRSEEEHRAVLASILEATNTYIQGISQFNPIISVMGYLHNVSTGEYVTIGLLERLGYLGEEYLAEDALILFLRPVDLNQFGEIAFEGIPAGQMVELTVFLGYETPTGIGLYSRFGAQAIFRENLNQLIMNDYNPNNGAIFRPTSQDAIYQAVVEMITNAANATDVFIRYLAVDDAHGFVAFSTEEDVHSITNYVFSLARDEGSLNLRVLAMGFEATLHPKAAINGAAPGFNLGLMPDYDITNTNLSQSDAEIFLSALLALEQFEQVYEDYFVFVSATSAFAYAVSVYGDIFFGQYNSGWSAVPVDGWQAAQGLMADNVNNPPLYIIWQQ